MQPVNPLESIFAAAVEISSEAERQRFVEQACAGDTELKLRVEEMVENHFRAGNFLEPPTAGDPDVRGLGELRSLAERPGSVIGNYKLLEQIGEGGFGIVFMAEQQEPIRRKVALKVLKPGMDSRQVIARFEAERQALALMDHPNIAKVLDAGTTEPAAQARESTLACAAGSGGRPYFVMELVKGLPITELCDQNRLTLRERLKLFIDVCQAVQHAHQKGIIHRDLKPSNVLVTLQDGAPLVKVIDFGIAKALDQQLTDKTLFTGFAQMIGTPLYMSPEQAALSNVDVDTRSDIYSLGVVLYELLTGTTPFPKERLKEIGYDELRRIIREEEPPKPSTRISTLGKAASTVSTQRRSDPKQLSRLFRGELDWIVMKALDKDRNRRYESASAFAADVQRYLDDEAVQACPPSVGYRLRKFVRRHKGPVLAASVILFVLVAGIVGTTTGMVWALDAEQDAISQSNQKTKALEKAVAAAKAESEARRQTAWERDQKDLALQAETRARKAEKHARTRAMNALRQLTDEVVQQQLARRATLTDEDRRFLRDIQRHYEEFAALPGDDAEQRAIRAEGHLQVASVREGLGEQKEAEASIQVALALYQGLVAEFPKKADYRHWLARSHNLLGIVLQHTGQPKHAETAFAEALALRKQLAEQFPDNTQFQRELAAAYYSQATALLHAGRLTEAEPGFIEALALQKKLVAKFPIGSAFRRELALSHSNLGVVFRETGRLPQAETAFAEARALQKQLVDISPGRPEFRQELANGYHNLGLFLQTTNRPKEAEAAYADAIALYQQLVADFPLRLDFRQELARSHNNRGVLFSDTGRPKEAETAYDDALAIRKRLAGDFPKRPEFRHDLIETHHNLSMLLQTRGRLKEAETAYLDNLARCHQLVADFPKKPAYLQALARAHNNLGVLYFNTDRMGKAQEAFVEVLTVSKELNTHFPDVPDHQMHLASAMHNLAVLANARGDYNGARRWLDESLPHHKAALKANPREPTYRQFFRNRLFTLVESYAGTGDATGAVKTAEQLRDLGWNPPVNAFDAACTMGLCVGIVYKKDSKQARLYADQAMAMLREAVTRGYRDAARMKQDRFLEPLRQREDFRHLLAEVEGKTKK
ncbi:MAG TPA: serine/threonine-protein kinase [Gemmataceae bacterium]|nr:serine/threonine-protein kinase [Gemmataceae bacterium]